MRAKADGHVRRTATETAEAFLPQRDSLKALRQAAAHCRGCDLYKDATQTVFGEGSARAALMLVGEQPGDVEDRQGHPFVGPAGALLHRALAAAGIPAREVYVTNAVKHFKYVWRGKRRIHAKPKRIEVQACSPWLAAEIHAVRPRIVVALGATAAAAFHGPRFRLSDHRGQFLSTILAERVLATVHPSSILRSADAETRHAAMQTFVDDLSLAWNEADGR